VANQKRQDGPEAEIIARLHAIREEVQKLRDDLRVPAKFSGTRPGRPAEPPAETREPEPASRRPNAARRARKKR
jgi:hypothetical protein